MIKKIRAAFVITKLRKVLMDKLNKRLRIICYQSAYPVHRVFINFRSTKIKGIFVRILCCYFQNFTKLFLLIICVFFEDKLSPVLSFRCYTFESKTHFCYCFLDTYEAKQRRELKMFITFVSRFIIFSQFSFWSWKKARLQNSKIQTHSHTKSRHTHKKSKHTHTQNPDTLTHKIQTQSHTKFRVMDHKVSPWPPPHRWLEFDPSETHMTRLVADWSRSQAYLQERQKPLSASLHQTPYTIVRMPPTSLIAPLNNASASHRLEKYLTL
jgi:hypothetical protein